MGRNNNSKSKIKTVILIITIIVILFFTMLITATKIFPLKYKQDIIENSNIYNIDPYLIMAIIKAESNYRHNAVSSADAMGLMQITDKTGGQIAQGLDIENYSKEILFDPSINIRFGTWYVNWLLEQFEGNIDTALAAYNAGIGNVNKWLENDDYSSDGKNLDEIPYKETKNFVNRVNLYRDIYKVFY